MRNKLIKGRFWVQGYSPDGDSIRFSADDKADQLWFEWKKPGNLKKANNGQEIRMQLRLEAIDALETHYNSKYYQPKSFSIAAMDTLLTWLSIEVFTYSIDYSRITTARDGVPGAIVTTGLDMYERPIAFVYAGEIDFTNQDIELELPEAIIRKSINFKLLEHGLVYPTFYQGLEPNVLNLFRKTTQNIRSQKRGLWSIDRTNDFTLWETWTIRDDVVILPKLFRRLAAFIDNYSSYDQLEVFFKKSNDPLLLLTQNVRINFSDIIEIQDRRIQVKANPEDMLFIPK